MAADVNRYAASAQHVEIARRWPDQGIWRFHRNLLATVIEHDRFKDLAGWVRFDGARALLGALIPPSHLLADRQATVQKVEPLQPSAVSV